MVVVRCTCLLHIAPESVAHTQGSHVAGCSVAQLGSLPVAYPGSLQSRLVEIDMRQGLNCKPAFCSRPTDSVLQM